MREAKKEFKNILSHSLPLCLLLLFIPAFIIKVCLKDLFCWQ